MAITTKFLNRQSFFNRLPYRKEMYVNSLNLRFNKISFNIRGTDIKLLDNFREVAFHYLQDEFSFPLAEWRVSFPETKLQKKTHYYCQNREN